MALARPTNFVDLRTLPSMETFFGRTAAMLAAQEKLERFADTPVPILLQGESGTGKDILAKLIHARSSRSNSPYVKVTCPAIPQTLIESELFGYEKGAFTGAYATKRGRIELAHQGTLFLDEVGSLDISVQAKLLQVLQDGTYMRVGGQESRMVSTRLVCAANENLRQQIDEGLFRLDLFFRINAVTIELMPLRKRAADLPGLVEYFMELYARQYRIKPRPISRELMNKMQRYNWPGNIRQLENVIRSFVLIGNEETLAQDLVWAESPQQTSPGVVPEIDIAHPISLKEITKTATKELERAIILKVLEANDWSRQKTAKWLNISYRSLLYKLQESQVSPLSSRGRKAPAQPAPSHRLSRS